MFLTLLLDVAVAVREQIYNILEKSTDAVHVSNTDGDDDINTKSSTASASDGCLKSGLLVLS